MVFRLPDHVLHQLLIRIEANQPVRQIVDELGVGKSSVYCIMDTLDAWGVPYAPPTVKLGCERLLAECHVEVCDIHLNNVIYILNTESRVSSSSSKTGLPRTSMRCSNSYTTPSISRSLPVQYGTISSRRTGVARLYVRKLQSEVSLCGLPGEGYNHYVTTISWYLLMNLQRTKGLEIGGWVGHL
jgi:hypothetical protein